MSIRVAMSLILPRQRGARRLRLAMVMVVLLLAAPRVAGQTRAPAASDTAALAQLRAENARLAARVDSLSESLRENRFAENFLDSALQSQTALYACVVAVILAAFGILTYNGFRDETTRLSDDLSRKVEAALEEMRNTEANVRSRVDSALEEQRRRAATADQRIAEVERFGRRAAGNAYQAIGILGGVKPGSAFATWLLASASYYAADTPGRNRTNEVAAFCKQKAFRDLDNIEQMNAESRAQELKREPDRIREALEILRGLAGAEPQEAYMEAWVKLKALGFDPSEDATVTV